ncbi:hypothetical protein CSB45_10560 [candidate division KSB3 bacterium]|uniref:DUF4388 domain-containing protein n=1 Tax=candidate division KSB3 bacterium TaxID=2044937 RepID=A0A2G6E3M6_9BACT|nr:MAG: hypothetical protein CSB45_10560 [candidate division KSB3 bacterium]PIE29145.1 MAG: hypothetical protein CSA57_10065 [candidate division KSB3 bacterium]
MLYPQGKTVIGDLKTAFVNIDGVLQEMKNAQFTGYVRISSEDYDGLVIYEDGLAVESVENYSDGRPRVEGAEAMTNVIAKTKEGNGLLNIQELPSNVINMVLRAIHSKVVYKDLLSDFTQIKNLLVTLKTKQITGHVEIEMNDGAGEAFIFLEDGKLIESLFSSGDGTTFSGKKGLAKILEVANEVGYIMNVFRAENKDVNRRDDLGLRGEASEEAAEFVEDPGELLEIFEKMVHSVDQSLQKMLGKNTFRKAFLQAVKQKSSDYPFLNALGKNISSGTGFVLNERVSIEDFVFGMSDVFDQSVSFVSTPKNESKLKESIRIGLGQVKMIYEEQIQEFNLDTVLFEYLG